MYTKAITEKFRQIFISILAIGILFTSLWPESRQVHAQESDHQIVTVIENFAFDPPILITNDQRHVMNGPVSLRAMTSPQAASISFSDLTILGVDGLWLADNQPEDGYLGFEETQLSVDFPLNDPQARHLLTNIDQFRGLDTLVFVPGTKDIFTISSRNQRKTETSFDKTIQDVAALGTTQPTPDRIPTVPHEYFDILRNAFELTRHRASPTILAILFDGYVHFMPSTRLLENSAGSIPPIRTEIVSLSGKGQLITGYKENQRLIYIVAGDFRNGPGLKLLTSSERVTRPNVNDTAYLDVGSNETEKFIRLAMHNLDNDRQPEAVLLTAVQANGAEFGRVRIFDVTSAATIDGPGAQFDIKLPISASEVIADAFSNGEEILTMPTALRLADIAPIQGRSGPDDNVDIVIAGNVGLQKSETQRPFVQIWSQSGDGVWTKTIETIVDEAVNQSFTTNPFVTDLEVGKYNADKLPDVILSDSQNNGLILLKQQPLPCLTFITSITHGHQGTNSILGIAGDNPVIYNDSYNAMLSDRVEDINAARRTPAEGEPELCPVAHIGVNGHWEEQTEEGALRHVIGRAGWLIGAALPSPACFRQILPPITPHSHLHPVLFWLSSIWLLVPTPPPPFTPTECVPLSIDYASAFQFASAGLGAGVEWWGRSASAPASRQAANELKDTIYDAVATARSSMDACTGQIMLDTFGFSRGTAVTSEALQLVDTRPLQYNADVSLTVFDAIDPSWGPPYRNNSCPGTEFFNGDSIRPWAKSGYIVGDPTVRPAGSAMVSSMYTGMPDVTVPYLEPIAGSLVGLVSCFPPDLYNFSRDVVGTPSGYDRSTSLTVAAGGRFASAEDLTHVQARNIFFGTWDLTDPPANPTPLTAQPVNYNDDQFSFADVTHMGMFINNPRMPIPDLPGWLRNQPVDQPIDADDSDRLPTICAEATGNGPVEDESDPEQTLSVYNNVRDREFVTDPEFDFSQGIVTNAAELVEIDNMLPKDKEAYRLDLIFPEPMPDFIRDTAKADFPTSDDQSGSWMFVDSPNSCVEQGTGNCLKLRSSSSASLTEQFAARFAHLIPPGADLTDEDTLNALQEQWEAATLDSDQQLSADRVNLYQQLLSGGSRLDEAYVLFPQQEVTLRQTLEPGSRSHSRLVVRVFYAMPGNNGALEVRLKGQNLDVTESVDPNGVGFRRELMFVAERSGDPDFGLADMLELSGKDVLVFTVSVRAEMPRRNPVNGHYYDYIVFDGGTDWEAAWAIAQRWTFQGRKGSLATFSGADFAAYNELREMFNPDTFVWLGAKGPPTNPKAFDWIDNVPFVYSSWYPGTTFDPDATEDSYLFAYPNTFLFGHAPPSVTRQGKPFGFFIDYGP